MASHYDFSDFELHPASRALLWRGTAVAIEPKVFDVLAYLVEHRDRAVGRDELIAAVWGRVDVADATLQQAISRLRRVLREVPESPFVRTVPRHGYQWVAATRHGPPPQAIAAEGVQAGERSGPPADEVPPVPARRPSSWPAARWLALATCVVILLGALLHFGWHFSLRQPRPEPGAGTPVTSPGRTAYPQRECPPHTAADDCVRTLSSLLAQDTLPPRKRAALLLERAEQHLRAAAVDRVVQDLDEMDRHVDAVAQPELTARALFLRHRIAVLGGRADEAMAYGQRALALYRSQDASDAHAELLHSLGAFSGRRGELAPAESWLDAALSMYLLTKNDEGAARVLATRAYTLSQQGRFAEALAAAHDAQARAASLASAEVRREALIALAWASIQNGRLSEAREAVHTALALPGGTPQQTVSLRALLGFIDAAGGRFPDALAAWDEALALTSQDSQPAAAGLRLAIVYAALQYGDRARAQEQFAQLQRLATAAPELQQSVTHAAALLALADGDDERAARHFAEVWKAARSSGSLNQQMLADYADVLLRRKQLDTLELLLGEPALPAQEGHLYQLVQARYLASRGRREDARAAFDRARALAGERYTRWLDVARREVAADDATH